MSSLGTITFKGGSGRTYDFSIYRWGQEFNSVGAVYAITRASGQSHSVLYIGQTGDLSERFDNHHKAGCFARNGVTHICVRPESSEVTRLAIERDLLAGYTTTCND